MAKTLNVGTEWLWTDSVPPGVSETNVSVGNFWLDTSTDILYFLKDPTPGVQVWDRYLTPTVSVSDGGTGATTLTDDGVLIGNGTAAVSVSPAGTTGTVLIGNTGSGPTFSDTPTLTSVTFGAGTDLSDYLEQQTWTPAITGTTVAGVGTYTTQSGYYTRIGNMIFIQASLTWTAHTGTGDMIISGLPFASRNSANYEPHQDLFISNINVSGGNNYQLFGIISPSQSSITLAGSRDNNPSIIQSMDTSGTINFSMSYLT